MITGDDNKDDNGYSRVKAWRAKNRVLWNLKQKEYRRRKKNLPVPVLAEPYQAGLVAGLGEARESTGADASQTERDSRGGQTLPFETKKVGEFRMLVLPEEPQERPVMPVVKPKVFFNDHGAVISEKVWNQLQEKKREALESGYEFDPQ
jgi:hypothetical protein